MLLSEIGKTSRIWGVIDKKHSEWVHIGEYVVLGSESRIITHGPIRSFYNNPNIYIDDLVWIGFRSIILPGVHIKKGTIIGAGSVVTGDTEKFSIYAGNPARFIKTRDDYEILRTFVIKWLMDKTLRRIENIEWKLLKKKHINYIFDDGRYDNMGINEILKKCDMEKGI